MDSVIPKLYSDLAEWWPLLSPPSDYVEEAADLLPFLSGDGENRGRLTLLELGSGGGSFAFQLKQHFALTLTDLSPAMLAVSEKINPECEHICADMRTLDLPRVFDRVLIHDAIMYATSHDAVRAVLHTAVRHCRDGGVIIVMPDCVRETFEAATESGGYDGTDGRGLRYLEWTWDPDPEDFTLEVAYAFLLRDPNGHVLVELDRHTVGCFPKADWLALFEEAGLKVHVHHDRWNRDIFIGRRA